MTARSRRRTAALLFGLLLAIVTQATAHSQVMVPAMPAPVAAPIGGAPMPASPGAPPPVVTPDGGGAMPAPVITPGGFGSVRDFSGEVQIQDLIRAYGGPSLQPLSVSDYRLRPETSRSRASGFRLQDPTQPHDRFQLVSARPASGSEPAGDSQDDQQRLAWPAIVSNCLDSPPPGSATACPS